MLVKNKCSNQKISTSQLLQNKQTLGEKKQSSFQGSDVKTEGNEQLALMNKAAIGSPLEKAKAGIQLYREYTAATPDVTSSSSNTKDITELALALIDPEVRKNFSEKKADSKLQNLLKQMQNPKVASAVLGRLEKALDKTLQIAEDETEAKAILKEKNELKSFKQLIKTAVGEQDISFKGKSTRGTELFIETLHKLPTESKEQVIESFIGTVRARDLNPFKQVLSDCNLSKELKNDLYGFMVANIGDKLSRNKLLNVLSQLNPDDNNSECLNQNKKATKGTGLLLNTLYKVPPQMRKQLIKSFRSTVEAYDTGNLKQVLTDCKLSKELKNDLYSFMGANIADKSSRKKILSVLNQVYLNIDGYIGSSNATGSNSLKMGASSFTTKRPGFITKRFDKYINRGELIIDTIQQVPPHLRSQLIDAIKAHDMEHFRRLLPDCKLTEEIQNEICSFMGVNIDDEASRGRVLNVLNRFIPDHDDHINHDVIDSRHVLLNARHAEIDAGDTIEHAAGADVSDGIGDHIPIGTAIASGLRIANHLRKGERKKACIEAGVTTAKVAAVPVTVPAKVAVASTTATGGGLVGSGIGAGVGTFLCPGLGTAAGAAIGKGIGAATGGIVGFIASQKVENRVWEKAKKFLNEECVIM